MRKLLLLGAALLSISCDSPAAPDDRWEDPEKIQYAAALNVDLSQMTKNPSGLYWQDLVTGVGSIAGVGDSVTVHYRGWLPDGTMFDTSYDEANQPIGFYLAEGLVIKGWDEGLLGMKVGGRRRLVIPPSLGYPNGRGPIPPLTTLIFDIELLNVVKRR
jgi:FKBP-type peptidyl-prolyl cis-trans isomerase FkpA